jgi:hypothetical protein
MQRHKHRGQIDRFDLQYEYGTVWRFKGKRGQQQQLFIKKIVTQEHCPMPYNLQIAKALQHQAELVQTVKLTMCSVYMKIQIYH